MSSGFAGAALLMSFIARIAGGGGCVRRPGITNVEKARYAPLALRNG